MQTAFDFSQAADLHSIWDRLTVYFGNIRIQERPDPVSQLSGSILGIRTRDEISWNAFMRLLVRFQNWNAVSDAPKTDIENLIWDVTFSEKKALYLKQALQTIRAREGDINLGSLVNLPVEEALHWLEKIDGVGRKTAAATLNFSTIHGRAFVIDTHVFQVLRRFGFIGKNTKPEHAYDTVMAASDDFDADDLFELHWLLKILGQKTCSHAQACCASCPLSDICLQRVEKGAIKITWAPAWIA